MHRGQKRNTPIGLHEAADILRKRSYLRILAIAIILVTMATVIYTSAMQNISAQEEPTRQEEVYKTHAGLIAGIEDGVHWVSEVVPSEAPNENLNEQYFVSLRYRTGTIRKPLQYLNIQHERLGDNWIELTEDERTNWELVQNYVRVMSKMDIDNDDTEKPDELLKEFKAETREILEAGQSEWINTFGIKLSTACSLEEETQKIEIDIISRGSENVPMLTRTGFSKKVNVKDRNYHIEDYQNTFGVAIVIDTKDYGTHEEVAEETGEHEVLPVSVYCIDGVHQMFRERKYRDLSSLSSYTVDVFMNRNDLLDTQALPEAVGIKRDDKALSTYSLEEDWDTLRKIANRLINANLTYTDLEDTLSKTNPTDEFSLWNSAVTEIMSRLSSETEIGFREALDNKGNRTWKYYTPSLLNSNGEPFIVVLWIGGEGTVCGIKLTDDKISNISFDMDIYSPNGGDVYEFEQVVDLYCNNNRTKLRSVRVEYKAIGGKKERQEAMICETWPGFFKRWFVDGSSVTELSSTKDKFKSYEYSPEYGELWEG